MLYNTKEINMKSKYILLLSVLLSGTAPLWAMQGDDEDANGMQHVQGQGLRGRAKNGTSQAPKPITLPQLQERIEEAKNETKRRLEKYDDSLTKVIVVGNSGNGKSALIHALAGTAIVKEKDEVFKFKSPTHNPFPDIIIGKVLGKHGTTFPGGWYDTEHEMVFWDTPGFGDPGCNGEDIANEEARCQIFTPGTNAKILLAISEGILYEDQPNAFQNLFNQIAGVFPNIDQLKESLSVVITKNVMRNPVARLKFLEKKGDLQKLTAPAKDLLRFIVDNSKKRIALFPAPEDDDYKFDRDSIFEIIAATVPTLNPTVMPYLNDSSQLLVSNFVQKLNDDAVDFLKREGAQQVIDFCKNEIDNYHGSIATLRTNLGQVIQDLRLLQNVSVKAKDFADTFDKFFRANNPLRKIIEGLDFLKSIKDDVIYNIPSWSQALNSTIDMLDNLIKVPQPVYDATTQILSLKGTLVGTKDIKAILKNHPSPVRIDIQALNTLIIDKNITSHGTSCSFIAPFWKVKGTKTIDLSGNPGNPIAIQAVTGTDGQSGNPGGSGGHFYGKGNEFNFPNAQTNNMLTINTTGGTGGDGQLGGKGKDGENGKDEEYPSADKGPLYKESTSSLPGHVFFNPNSPVSFNLGWNFFEKFFGRTPLRIGQIKIHAGEHVDSIEIFGRSGKNEMNSLGKAGGPGGTLHTISFASDERLTGYEKFQGDGKLHMLGLFTNKGKYYGPYGRDHNGQYSKKNDENKEVISISGYRVSSHPVIVDLDCNFSTVMPLQAATDGKQGGKGGDGGKAGIGGSKGSAIVKGAVFTHISNDGGGGNNGVGGQGGPGGKHGRYHMLKDRGSAGKGSTGGVSQVAPPAPIALPALNAQNIIDAYKVYHGQEASNPTVSPFVKAFPNLRP